MYPFWFEKWTMGRLCNWFRWQEERVGTSGFSHAPDGFVYGSRNIFLISILRSLAFSHEINDKFNLFSKFPCRQFPRTFTILSTVPSHYNCAPSNNVLYSLHRFSALRCMKWNLVAEIMRSRTNLSISFAKPQSPEYPNEVDIHSAKLLSDNVTSHIPDE